MHALVIYQYYTDGEERENRITIIARYPLTARITTITLNNRFS